MDRTHGQEEELADLLKAATPRKTRKITMELDAETIELWDKKIPFGYRSGVTRVALRYFLQSEEAKERFRGIWPTFLWSAVWGTPE